MKLSRRQLLAWPGGMLLTQGCARRFQGVKPAALGPEIERALAEARGPGMACGIVRPGQVRWSQGLGLADVEHHRPMLADTLINVGSVSKTVTATAVMQLWEQNRFGLQDDVGKHLPFALRNPHFPEVPITFEQLLTHRSSIKDNWPIYDRTYVCGDSPVALGDWLKGYFTPEGAYWDGRSIIVHGGRDPGVTAFVAFELASDIGVVCVRNFEVSQEDNYRLIAQLPDAGQRIG